MHKGSELASRPADFITSKINSGDKDSFTSFLRMAGRYGSEIVRVFFTVSM